jgi:radical SAM protein with 4Fe4S-binding SPASM domain
MPTEAQRVTRAGDLGQPHPVYCVWEITLACDLGCKHCGSRAGKPRPDELSTAQALDVVAQLHEVGVRDVVLIGGEAYLRDDWPVIARALVDRGITVNMTTGARNLTPERIEQAVAAGLSSISISIDGLERTHDAIRGVRGTFAAAVTAARDVARTSIQLSVNTQINRLSMPELPAIAELLVELGARAWQIQLTVAMGRAADRPELLLQPYELLDLFPRLVEIKDTTLEPHGIQLFPANNIGYFGPYEHRIRAGGETGRYWNGCPAGRWAIGIEADGTLKGCPSLPTQPYAGGNLAHERLADVIANAPQLRVLRERTAADLWGFCAGCYYADTCKGGCSWTAHSLLGRPGNNPYCIHRALQLEQRGLRERVVKVEAAPGTPFDHGRFELIEEPIATPATRPRRIVSLPVLDDRAVEAALRRA